MDKVLEEKIEKSFKAVRKDVERVKDSIKIIGVCLGLAIIVLVIAVVRVHGFQ